MESSGNILMSEISFHFQDQSSNENEKSINKRVFVSGELPQFSNFNRTVYKGTFNNEQVNIHRIPGISKLNSKVLEVIKKVKATNCLHLVKYHEITLEDFDLYIVTEVNGVDLISYMRQRLATIPAIEIVGQIALGLQYLHASDIVHGNICPSAINIYKSKRTVKLGDFGLHILFGDQFRMRVSCENHLGITDWMAPEILIAYQEDLDPPIVRLKFHFKH